MRGRGRGSPESGTQSRSTVSGRGERMRLRKTKHMQKKSARVVRRESETAPWPTPDATRSRTRESRVHREKRPDANWLNRPVETRPGPRVFIVSALARWRRVVRLSFSPICDNRSISNFGFDFCPPPAPRASAIVLFSFFGFSRAFFCHQAFYWTSRRVALVCVGGAFSVGPRVL
jgi:hypothetical protein